jgi:hypothetical protein
MREIRILWGAGSALTAIGFVFLLLRNVVSIALISSMIIGWIPIIGPFIGGIWTLVLEVL